MANPSLFTNTRSVSECLPYPTITDLDSNTADCPFHLLDKDHRWAFVDSSITLLPLGTAINRVPPKCFQIGVVVIALGDSRQQGVSQINQ